MSAADGKMKQHRLQNFLLTPTPFCSSVFSLAVYLAYLQLFYRFFNFSKTENLGIDEASNFLVFKTLIIVTNTSDADESFPWLICM